MEAIPRPYLHLGLAAELGEDLLVRQPVLFIELPAVGLLHGAAQDVVALLLRQARAEGIAATRQALTRQCGLEIVR